MNLSHLSRKTKEYDAVYDASDSPEKVAGFESIRGIAPRVLGGGNAAVVMFGLDKDSLYNRFVCGEATAMRRFKFLKNYAFFHSDERCFHGYCGESVRSFQVRKMPS